MPVGLFSGERYPFSILPAVGFPVLAGSHASQLFKLAHEMQLIVITAKKRQGGDRHLRYTQKELCMFDPGMNDVLNAGGFKKLFIQMLEMGYA